MIRYVRYEPTTDAVARRYASAYVWYDLVVYHDAAATQVYARFSLVRPRGQTLPLTVPINGFAWPVQWLAPLAM